MQILNDDPTGSAALRDGDHLWCIHGMGRQNCVRVVLYRRSGARHLFFFQEYGPFGHGWFFGTLLILYAGIAPSGHVATQARAQFSKRGK